MNDVTITNSASNAVVLNDDQLELAQSHIKNLHFAVSTIAQGLEGETQLESELAHNCLAVAEYRLRDLMGVLGIETDGKAAMEARSERLRAANLRIRELETQLGQQQTPLQTQMGVQKLSEILKRWWSLEGFGHVSEMQFEPYGVKVQLCGMLFSPYGGLGSKRPATDRRLTMEWYASLTERGFVLCTEKGEGTPSIKDCDQSRDALVALISQRMPSAEIFAFESSRSKGLTTLREVKVLIRDYSDIVTLPQPEGDAE